MTKDAWVLRLKEESKDSDMVGDFYFDSEDGDAELDCLTRDLGDATLYYDKEKAIKEFKRYEQAMYEKFGENAVCNFGYTNMMENFEWVEVELTYPK